MKKLTVLGVTGSIGTQTVDVVLHHQDQFEIVAMSAGHNINKLEEIMAKLPVKHICVLEEKDRAYLAKELEELDDKWGISLNKTSYVNSYQNDDYLFVAGLLHIYTKRVA